jgi:hypothetical protein
MNERIKELMKQSMVEYQFDMRFSPEKFAELIVRECMAVAKYHTPDTEECEHTWLIHDKIGKHFGVEE